MADFFDSLNDKHIAFIKQQKIYFVATAGADGFVNVSPKGMDSLRIINNDKIAWLNVTGSGNESAAHVLENGRMTLMLCSYDKQPLILRIYGNTISYHPRDNEWENMLKLFPHYTGARNIFEIDIELVQTSCGYAVPYYEYTGERQTLNKWADKKGTEGIEEYWKEKNLLSINDKDTGIF